MYRNTDDVVEFRNGDETVAILENEIVSVINSPGNVIDLQKEAKAEQILADEIQAATDYASQNGYCPCKEECLCEPVDEDDFESILSYSEADQILSQCSLHSLQKVCGILSGVATSMTEDDKHKLHLVMSYVSVKSKEKM